LLLLVLCHAAFARVKTDISPVPVEDSSSPLPRDWVKTAAFMEIFVRSYKDSDGDGVGDLKGLIAQLDYLKDLGVTGLWLMPIGPSADHDHGYAQVDYRSIAPEYGTMADFELLLSEAHKRGIGVIIDFVVNHSANTNPLFLDAIASKDSPYRDWYVITDSDPHWGLKNNPWHVSPGQGVYYGIFSKAMPDWNLRNPRVLAYLEDSMRFWMNKGVDGFRLDAVTMLLEDGPTAYFNNPGNAGIVAQLRDTVKAYQNRYLICEVSEHPELYVNACGHAFAFGTQKFIYDSVMRGKVAPDLIAQLKRADRDRMPLTLQSHDFYVGDRLMNQFGASREDRYRVAAAIAILASATPFSYYGEEIGMDNNGLGGDPGLRAPMSWTGLGTAAGFSTVQPYRALALNAASHNVDAETGKADSLLEFYRALYHVRLAHPVLATGALRVLSRPGDSLLIFSRSSANETVYVAINVSDSSQTATIDTGKPNLLFHQAIQVAGRSYGVPITTDARGGLLVRLDARMPAVFALAKAQ
jgi:maltose alpha-D-glucosyltransferase/alpha-amylase